MFSELELYRAKRIIREMAKTNGVSEDEIRAEMNKAIEAGMSDPNTRRRHRQHSLLRLPWSGCPSVPPEGRPCCHEAGSASPHE